jgi:hypothetical protein
VIVPLLPGNEGESIDAFGVYSSDANPGRFAESEWDKKVLVCLADYAVIDLSLSEAVVLGKSIPDENLEGYQLLACTKSAGIPTIVVSGINSPLEVQRAYMDHSILVYTKNNPLIAIHSADLLRRHAS